MRFLFKKIQNSGSILSKTALKEPPETPSPVGRVRRIGDEIEKGAWLLPGFCLRLGGIEQYLKLCLVR